MKHCVKCAIGFGFVFVTYMARDMPKTVKVENERDMETLCNETVVS